MESFSKIDDPKSYIECTLHFAGHCFRVVGISGPEFHAFLEKRKRYQYQYHTQTLQP